ncbi:hypothetical protein [Caballeronia eucalypticola]|uniref:hypothetical protein n=1 Tax=Caballeronia sp. 15715 TaxID=3391030 RepID=UPI0039E60F86
MHEFKGNGISDALRSRLISAARKRDRLSKILDAVQHPQRVISDHCPHIGVVNFATGDPHNASPFFYGRHAASVDSNRKRPAAIRPMKIVDSRHAWD